MTFVEISLQDVQAVLRPERGWRVNRELSKGQEYVFDWTPGSLPEVVIRAYTSIPSNPAAKRPDKSRRKGSDALRIAGLVRVDGKLIGLVKAPHVKRVINWRKNLISRILYVRDTAFRLKQSGKIDRIVKAERRSW